MRQPLTTRQAAIYAYLREQLAATQHLPTLRDVCERFGFASPNGALGHFKLMAAKGWLVQGGRYGGYRLAGVKVTVEDAP